MTVIETAADLLAFLKDLLPYSRAAARGQRLVNAAREATTDGA